MGERLVGGLKQRKSSQIFREKRNHSIPSALLRHFNLLRTLDVLSLARS